MSNGWPAAGVHALMRACSLDGNISVPTGGHRVSLTSPASEAAQTSGRLIITGGFLPKCARGAACMMFLTGRAEGDTDADISCQPHNSKGVSRVDHFIVSTAIYHRVMTSRVLE